MIFFKKKNKCRYIRRKYELLRRRMQVVATKLEEKTKAAGLPLHAMDPSISKLLQPNQSNRADSSRSSKQKLVVLICFLISNLFYYF